jgi:hypothetical protein
MIAEHRVGAFGLGHSIRLPPEYRDFLVQIGDGGAGPYHGVFPLGTVDDRFAVRAWRVNDSLVADPSRPFWFEGAWERHVQYAA